MMSQATEPHSRQEIAAALEEVHRDVAEYFRSLSRDEFFRRPEAEVWSPAENLIHLVKAVKAVASGLGMPKLFLRVSFGTSKAGSRTFDGVREVYLDRLRRGGRATGRFVPPAPDATDGDATRKRALSGWDAAGRSLVEKLRKWSEADLDKYRLPHPLLGKLTMREMAFFTLYHDRHHLTSVRERLAADP